MAQGALVTALITIYDQVPQRVVEERHDRKFAYFRVSSSAALKCRNARFEAQRDAERERGVRLVDASHFSVAGRRPCWEDGARHGERPLARETTPAKASHVRGAGHAIRRARRRAEAPRIAAQSNQDFSASAGRRLAKSVDQALGRAIQIAQSLGLEATKARAQTAAG